MAAFPAIEWVIHVGILHWRPRRVGPVEIDSLLARKHREHHADPRDLPLVFIPWQVLAWLLPAYVVVALLAVPSTPAAWSLLVSVYALKSGYEWTHYLIHSDYRPRGRAYRAVWRNHRLHHYKNEHYWFTVTSCRHRRPALRHLPRSRDRRRPRAPRRTCTARADVPSSRCPQVAPGRGELTDDPDKETLVPARPRSRSGDQRCVGTREPSPPPPRGDLAAPARARPAHPSFLGPGSPTAWPGSRVGDRPDLAGAGDEGGPFMGRFHRAIGLVVFGSAVLGAVLLGLAIALTSPGARSRPTHGVLFGVWKVVYDSGAVAPRDARGVRPGPAVRRRGRDPRAPHRQPRPAFRRARRPAAGTQDRDARDARCVRRAGHGHRADPGPQRGVLHRRRPSLAPGPVPSARADRRRRRQLHRRDRGDRLRRGRRGLHHRTATPRRRPAPSTRRSPRSFPARATTTW